MLKLSTIYRVLPNLAGSKIIKTQGASGAHAIVWTVADKVNKPKFRTTLFSKELEALYQEEGRPTLDIFFKKHARILNVRSYWRTDEESGTEFLVHQLCTDRISDDNKFASLSSLFSDIDDGIDTTTIQLKVDSMSLQDELESFMNSFSYDTRATDGGASGGADGEKADPNKVVAGAETE